MMLPPAIMKLRLVENGRKRVGLWIPIFLLWPFLALAALISTPLLAAVMFALSRNARTGRALGCVTAILETLCSLRGLTIEVHDHEEEMLIKII